MNHDSDHAETQLRKPVQAIGQRFDCRAFAHQENVSEIIALPPDGTQSVPESQAKENSGRSAYLQAIARTEVALRRQRAALEAQGWQVIGVPSMPDLHWSINYLNGIQDRTRYLMPAWGVFYSKLDQAAATAFQTALGDAVKIVPLLCNDSQRTHGEIHCMVSAFPRADSAGRTQSFK